MSEEVNKHQSAELRKYKITPFEGDHKDWLRFWNKSEVQVDQLKIAEISNRTNHRNHRNHRNHNLDRTNHRKTMRRY